MSSQTKKPLKGILKKPKSTPESAVPALPTSIKTNPRDPRAIAVQHARLLQDRKDIEARIFDNILALIDYPIYTSHPSSSPHPDDISGFVSLVRIFQPSDYDDLIVERNLNDNRCGYVLCPNKRRRYKGAGTFKLVNQGKKDFDIVETGELEKWCSTECTRRALWVKVQLNETAAWERVGLPEIGIDLYPEKDKQGDEDKTKEDSPAEGSKKNEKQAEAKPESDPEKLATDMAKLQFEQDRKAANDAVVLALERGDDAKDTGRAVDITIREKTVTTAAEAPSLSDNSIGGAIEGYKAKFGTKPESDVEDDTADWLE